MHNTYTESSEDELLSVSLAIQRHVKHGAQYVLDKVIRDARRFTTHPPLASKLQQWIP